MTLSRRAWCALPLAVLAACTNVTSPTMNVTQAIADARLIVGDQKAGSGLWGVLAAFGPSMKPADAATATTALTVASGSLDALTRAPPDLTNTRAAINSVLALASQASRVLAASGAINNPRLATALQAAAVLVPIVSAIVNSVPQPPGAGTMTPGRARAVLAVRV